jgi:hypothetical protein
MLDGTGPLLCIEVEEPGGPHESGYSGRAVSAGVVVHLRVFESLPAHYTVVLSTRTLVV